jgi:hypothetical protein
MFPSLKMNHIRERKRKERKKKKGHTDRYKGAVHAFFESIDPGVIVALGFNSAGFPKFVGTTVKVTNHAWSFRLLIRFRARGSGSIARSRDKKWATSHGYIYIRQVIQLRSLQP